MTHPLVFPAAAIAGFCALSLASCETRSAAERRVDRHPALFTKLSSSQQTAVLDGDVREGMSRDAVYLAWGRPDVVRAGSRHGKKTEHWAWLDRQSVQVGISYGYGYGYGPHPFYHHFGVHPRYGYCFGPDWRFSDGLEFGTSIRKTVDFSGDRVVAWEERR